MCSVEEGDRQDQKAPLLLAYEQVYLPKPSKKQASEEEDQPHSQSASHRTRASRRCRVPEWRDVLLTAALLWLAATGLILIIAMVKVGMYQVRTMFLEALQSLCLHLACSDQKLQYSLVCVCFASCGAAAINCSVSYVAGGVESA